MNKTIVWEFDKFTTPQWQAVVFCGWLACGDDPGAVVERNGLPYWVPLENLRLTDPTGGEDAE